MSPEQATTDRDAQELQERCRAISTFYYGHYQWDAKGEFAHNKELLFDIVTNGGSAAGTYTRDDYKRLLYRVLELLRVGVGQSWIKNDQEAGKRFDQLNAEYVEQYGKLELAWIVGLPRLVLKNEELD